jgi:hypothetical protein
VSQTSQQWGKYNMVLSPAGLRPEKDCVGEAQQQKQITDPSPRQKGLHKITNPQLSKGNFKEKEKLVKGTRHQDRLAD